MSAVTIVLVDANVLYSRTLRDWIALLNQSADGLFDVAWTEDIMVEVLYHLRKDHPFWSDEQVGGIRRKLENVFSGGQISGYGIDAAREYPDIFDAHVHAAAVHGSADMVVTANGKDFPYSDDLPYEIYHPDDFLLLIDDAAPQIVQAVVEQQLCYFHAKDPGANGVDLPLRLKTANAPLFAERVRQHLQHVDISILKNASVDGSATQAVQR